MIGSMHIHKVVNVTIQRIHTFPAKAGEREAFVTRNVVVTTEDGSRLDLTLLADSEDGLNLFVEPS
jgi:hypothetical protein